MHNLLAPFSLKHMLGSLVLIAAMTGATAHADTREIETAYGPVSIDGTPERVVTLYEGALDAAIATGIKPVGAVITRGGNHVAKYIQPKAKGVEIVGAPGETNIESVIALNPDLILAPAQLSKEQYNLLSKIAPTIVPGFTAFTPKTWKQETRLFAKALGRADAGEEAVARVEDKAAEVATLVDNTLDADQRETGLIRWMPQGPLVMSEGLFSASLLNAAGFEVNSANIVKNGRPHSHPLSQENLGLIDHSWIFLATLNADGDEALEAARKSPAFQRLKANNENRIIPVNGQLWTSASGPLAAMQILDDIAAAMNNIAANH
ncbi:ABC transporter substrate-binding protein [Marinobacter sp.]|uniref:ABC transporter substrate-binding protein n=1 Tax=Marinobacter sp. TaxID=50741 RepID=UPI003F957F26